MKVYNHILQTIEHRGAAFFLLVDPDYLESHQNHEVLDHCSDYGIDAVMIGGSVLLIPDFEAAVRAVKKRVDVPLIIFPGGGQQVAGDADAVLYLSLISGRNPHYLIGDHVLAAPRIKAMNLEPISTGYMLIESGKTSSAEYISNTKPIPREKTEIAMAHALAAEYMGMKLIYLEAGSGAENPIPLDMISKLKSYISIPIIVGGGIRSPDLAKSMVERGASIIVVGNAIERNHDPGLTRKFADAIHIKG